MTITSAYHYESMRTFERQVLDEVYNEKEKKNEYRLCYHQENEGMKQITIEIGL